MAPVNIKTLKLLTLLEHAPKYAQQLCRLAPEIFSGRQRSLGGLVHDGRVYAVMHRIAGQGYIRRMSDYAPPPTADVPEAIAGRVTWYCITPQGRKALREAREALQLTGVPTNA